MRENMEMSQDLRLDRSSNWTQVCQGRHCRNDNIDNIGVLNLEDQGKRATILSFKQEEFSDGRVGKNISTCWSRGHYMYAEPSYHTIGVVEYFNEHATEEWCLFDPTTNLSHMRPMRWSENYAQNGRTEAFALKREGTSGFKACTCINEEGGKSCAPRIKIFTNERDSPESMWSVPKKSWNSYENGIFSSSVMTVEWLSNDTFVYGHRNGSLSLVDSRGGGNSITNVFSGMRRKHDKNRGEIQSISVGRGDASPYVLGAFRLGGGMLFDIRKGGGKGGVIEYLVPDTGLTDNEIFCHTRRIRGICADESSNVVMIPHLKKTGNNSLEVRLGCWTREGKLFNGASKTHVISTTSGGHNPDKNFSVWLSCNLMGGRRLLLSSEGKTICFDTTCDEK